MKTTKTIETHSCDICGNDGGYHKCEGCGIDICYNCVEDTALRLKEKKKNPNALRFQTEYGLSISSDPVYCKKCLNKSFKTKYLQKLIDFNDRIDRLYKFNHQEIEEFKKITEELKELRKK